MSFMNKTDPRTTQQLLDWLDAMPDGHYLNECNRFGAIRARLVAAEQMAKALEVLEAIANAYDQIDEKRKKCFVDEGRPSPPPMQITTEFRSA